MIVVGTAIGFVLLLWWFATGAILWLDRLDRRTFPWTVAAATLVLAACIFGLAATSDDRSVGGAVLACACSIGVWGWNELLFLTGLVTGPNRKAPTGALQGGARFKAAASSVLHHELALAASLVAVAAVTLPGGNLVGLWTFLILWVMRLSAKLNIFFGVPNPGLQFLPDHLAYLGGHFRSGPVGAFFAVTTTAATATLATLVAAAALSEGGDFEATAATLLCTLLALAIIEHWFLALPLPTERLWGIGRRVRQPTPPDLPSTLRSLARFGAKA